MAKMHESIVTKYNILFLPIAKYVRFGNVSCLRILGLKVFDRIHHVSRVSIFNITIFIKAGDFINICGYVFDKTKLFSRNRQ